MVILKDAIKTLEQLGGATLLSTGPIAFTGVGHERSVCEHGAYSVKTPVIKW